MPTLIFGGHTCCLLPQPTDPFGLVVKIESFQVEKQEKLRTENRMGSSQSVFNEEELEEYQELTYFTKKEILHVHKRYKQLDSARVEADRNAKMPIEKIRQIPELKVNPFSDRICKVFSSSGDGEMTFEDFLDMMSVFSDAAPKSVKVEYAFRIYDFDEDDMISDIDLKEVVNRLTGEQQLSDDQMNQLIQNILDEADLDADDSLSFAEFEHVISKAPDFVDSFRIRL